MPQGLGFFCLGFGVLEFQGLGFQGFFVFWKAFLSLHCTEHLRPVDRGFRGLRFRAGSIWDRLLKQLPVPHDFGEPFGQSEIAI